jgi:chromate reductase
MMLCCKSFSTSQGLNLALITGTTRSEGPPLPILGPRVASFITNVLEDRGNTVTVIDPNDLQLLQKPHFCYAKSQVPPKLEAIYTILNDADGYVCVTPEYNHAPSPAILNVLNHFGSSAFSFKPSAIVSYSAGQWGGTRAAIGLRPVLSELGCLPVSAMVHIPHAQDVLDDDGTPTEDPQKWQQYCDRSFSQLEWWATAAKRHRTQVDPFGESPSFRKSPIERNAP